MKNLSFLLLMIALLAACNNPQTSEQSHFVHSVYFWLKSDVTEAQKADFEKQLHKLGKIASVQKISVGKPAGTARKVVDNSYSYALIVHFKDKAGHDAYQSDPIHKAVVGAFSDMIDDIKIYDVVY